MKQGVDKSEEAGLLNPEKAIADVQSSPVGRWLLGLTLGFVWMGVSSGLIILNKQLMSKDGFHYPMALSALGMSFSSVASYFCCRVVRLVEAKKVVTFRFWCTRILPVGLFMALTLHFGNLVYLYLTVAFIQMLKAFTPIVTMVALFIAGLETPTRRLITAVVLIASGTAMASYGELNLSVLGLIIMFLSEGFESARLVMTQILLVGLKFHPIEGLMYLAPACTLWLFLGIMTLEYRLMVQEEAFQLMASRPLAYCAAAAMGFCVNALAYIVIQTSSSLTLKVLGTAKNAIVVWIGIVFLGETVTVLQGAGYAISLGGFAAYNYLKMQPDAAGSKSGAKASAPAYSALPTKEEDGDEPGATARRAV